MATGLTNTVTVFSGKFEITNLLDRGTNKTHKHQEGTVDE